MKHLKWKINRCLKISLKSQLSKGHRVLAGSVKAMSYFEALYLSWDRSKANLCMPALRF